MQNKIFIVTGEPSGDKLAAKVISKLKKVNNEIDYLCVGGTNLKNLGLKSIFDIHDITYVGFTDIILNLKTIKKKINFTVNKILEFNPDILFTVDSPDFTLRVANLVKLKNNKIKTIHYVSPQVWVWRKGRARKIANYIDHILLLFNFEKKYYKSSSMQSTFVGHPLLDGNIQNLKENIELGNSNNNNEIISIFPGSRKSEIKILMPILIDFIHLMKQKYKNLHYVFHITYKHQNEVYEFLNKSNLFNCEVVHDEIHKSKILSRTKFAIAKSGTISLEISNAGIPSIIIYKMNLLNFLITRLVVKVKYINIFNIISNSEIIPELLQYKCNPKNIFNVVKSYIENPELRKNQITNLSKVITGMKTEISSTEMAANILNKALN